MSEQEGRQHDDPPATTVEPADQPRKAAVASPSSSASEESSRAGESETCEESEPEEEEGLEETEAIKPARMYFSPTHYQTQIKLGTRCHIGEAIETILTVKPSLTNMERMWFEEHPQFRHLFHMARDRNHKVQGMWMLLLRNAQIEKKKEAWFIVNGVPVRYGLREHALISGLDCRNYPLGYEDFGTNALVNRHFKEGTIRMEDVKATLLEMGPHKDRLKIAVLYFLSSVICAQTKVGDGAKPVLGFFQRAADDLEFCKTFPWGRYSFDYMLDKISHTMKNFNGKVKVKAPWIIPGFCLPLELLAFEAIPKLGDSFRVAVPGADPHCPRMCQSEFKPSNMTGFPLSKINSEMSSETDIDSILPTRNVEEKELLEEIFEEDDHVDKPDLAVDSWMKRLGEGFTVFFEDMYEEDVAARVEKDEVALPVIEGTDLRDVLKSLKKMGDQLKKVEKKVDKFEKTMSMRMLAVEAFVKEAQKR